MVDIFQSVLSNDAFSVCLILILVFVVCKVKHGVNRCLMRHVDICNEFLFINFDESRSSEGQC